MSGVPARPGSAHPGSARPGSGGRGADGLGLRRAIPERMLPSLVAAMAFLAALALGGAVGARLLAQRWHAGAGGFVTVQVPDPGLPAAGAPPDAEASRIDAVMTRLGELARAPGGPSEIRRLPPEALRRLLRPWLGDDEAALPLPAVVQLRLPAAGDVQTPVLGLGLVQALVAVAPGTLVENGAAWSDRLLALTDSLQACAGLALLTVAAVAGSVVALATRAGIATRRQAIEIVHGLGATDGYIAGRFARRAGRLALLGGAGGALVSLPVLAGLCHLAAPFAGDGEAAAGLGGLLPLPLLIGLPALPLAAGLIGWLTAQGTVRVWLRRLP